ncbi:MAG: hypothetical protein LUC90_07885 [Lachnospiraceae bacterium]|nr:hypothetical protein [Lachnospiraceae bacterium]
MKKILYLLAGAVCVICMLLIFPVGVIRASVESHNGADGRISVGPVSGGAYAEQYFIPQFRYIQEMAIALTFDEISDEDAVILFAIRDSAGEEVFSTSLSAAEFTSGSYYYFPVGIFLKKGQQYSWTVTAESSSAEQISLLATSPDVITPVENSLLYCNGELTSSAAVVDYVYGILPGKGHILIYDSFFATMFLLAVMGIRHLPEKKKASAF